MKLRTLINLYLELNHPLSVLNCKLSIGDKSELLDLLYDLKKKADLFDKEQIKEGEEIGIKFQEDFIIPKDTEQVLIERLMKRREEMLEEDINFDFSKYKISESGIEKISNYETELIPVNFIRIFIKKDLTDL